MPSKKELDGLYMGFALGASSMSKAQRKKVGGVLIKDDNVISYGWNGTPSGEDNNCEDVLPDGTLVTKDSVTHCEMNVYGKLLDSPHPVSTRGSVLYLTLSPCKECAKLIKRAGTTEVIYFEEYRNTEGINFLSERGVNVRQFSGTINQIEDGTSA
jgi:dCMP deaminase